MSEGMAEAPDLGDSVDTMDVDSGSMDVEVTTEVEIYDPGADLDTQDVVDGEIVDEAPANDELLVESGTGLDDVEGFETPKNWDGEGDHPGKAKGGVPETGKGKEGPPAPPNHGIAGGGGTGNGKLPKPKLPSNPFKRKPKGAAGSRQGPSSGGSGSGGGFTLIRVGEGASAIKTGAVGLVHSGPRQTQVHGISVTSGRPPASKRR
jgi:hypothetical protein